MSVDCKMDSADSTSTLESTDKTSKDSAKCKGLLGIMYATLAAAFASTSSLFAKYPVSASAAQIVLFRCVTQYICLLPPLSYKRMNPLGTRPDLIKYIMGRGAFGICSIILLFVAIKKMPLGDAIAISYTYSVLVGLFACVCLKERCGVLDFVFTFITATGVLFIAQPPFIFGSSAENAVEELEYSDRMVGILCAIGSALANSVTYIIVRKMGEDVHFILSLIYYSWEGVLVAGAYLAISNGLCIPCLGDFLFMGLVAIFGLVGQIFMTMALQIERAGPVTLVQTTQIIFAFIFQYIFLSVVPSLYSGIGSCLIFLSSFGITLWKFLSSRNNRNKNIADSSL